jgi:prophage regulatory protein
MSNQLLRFPAVQALTGCTRTMLDRLEKRDAFPRRVKLAARAIAWREDAVRAWVSSPADWKVAVVSDVTVATEVDG